MATYVSWRISERVPTATLGKTLALWPEGQECPCRPALTRPSTSPSWIPQSPESLLGPHDHGPVSFQPAVELHPGWCSQGSGTSTPAEQDPDNLRVSVAVGTRGSLQAQDWSDDP